MRRSLFPSVSTALLAGLFNFTAQAAEPTVIQLSQTGCQFVEPEGQDQHYRPLTADDCQTINSQSGAARLAASQVLRLKAGDYVFRVTNANVPYELGFWLRGSGLGRVTLPSVSGGGLTEGVTKDYAISLKPGEYRYSCPLNPTPDYVLIVEG